MDDRDRMNGRPMWVPWALTSVALLVVACIAYAIGVRHEVLVAGGEPVVRSSHFGFPGIFVFFLLFWIFGGLRWMWWGGPCYRPWRYRRRYYAPYDDEREWEEWHRREHERMEESRGRGGPSSPSSGGPSGGNNRDTARD